MHSFRRLEANRLERRRHERADRGVVLGEHHVVASLEHAQLGLERSWRPAEVRGRDHLEHELSRSGDAPRERAEAPNRPPDAEVERQGSAHNRDVHRDSRSPKGGRRQIPAPRHHSLIVVTRRR